MNASEKMNRYVELARESAKKAEREYDSAADQIQREASHNIDLLGRSALSQVAKLAAMSRSACENLYTSYQVLVRTLDENCRPLLAENPDAEAVKGVADLAAWLNAESEIENNFTASFNSTALGDVANVHFFPTMENRMVEQYWKQKYREHPGYEAAEAAIAAREEAERIARKKAIEAQKAAEEQFKREKNERKQYYNKVLGQVNGRVNDYRNALEAYLDEQKDAVLAATAYKVADLERESTALQLDMIKLDLYDFDGKKKLAEKLSEVKARISSLKNDAYGKNALKEYNDTINAAVKDYRAEMDKYLEKRFPFDKNKNKKMVESLPYEKLQIYRVLEEIKCGTVDDIMNAGGFTFSSQKCSALLRQMVEEGIVNREEIRRKAFFEINNEYIKNTSREKLMKEGIDVFCEDTSITAESMPVAPDPASVLGI